MPNLIAPLNLSGNKQFDLTLLKDQWKKNSARVIHANVDTYIRFKFIKGCVLSKSNDYRIDWNSKTRFLQTTARYTFSNVLLVRNGVVMREVRPVQVKSYCGACADVICVKNGRRGYKHESERFMSVYCTIYVRLVPPWNLCTLEINIHRFNLLTNGWMRILVFFPFCVNV